MDTPEYIQQIADVIHFDATQVFVSGDFDPTVLVATLKDTKTLADYADDNGNMQSAVRLDEDPNGKQGFWVTFPSNVDSSTVTDAVGNYKSKAQAIASEPTPVDLSDPMTVLDKVVENLPDGPIDKADLIKAFKAVG